MPTSSPLYNALAWLVYCIPVLAEQTLDLQEISKRINQQPPPKKAQAILVIHINPPINSIQSITTAWRAKKSNMWKH